MYHFPTLCVLIIIFAISISQLILKKKQKNIQILILPKHWNKNQYSESLASTAVIKKSSWILQCSILQLIITVSI